MAVAREQHRHDRILPQRVFLADVVEAEQKRRREAEQGPVHELGAMGTRELGAPPGLTARARRVGVGTRGAAGATQSGARAERSRLCGRAFLREFQRCSAGTAPAKGGAHDEELRDLVGFEFGGLQQGGAARGGGCWPAGNERCNEPGGQRRACRASARHTRGRGGSRDASGRCSDIFQGREQGNRRQRRGPRLRGDQSRRLAAAAVPQEERHRWPSGARGRAHAGRAGAAPSGQEPGKRTGPADAPSGDELTPNEQGELTIVVPFSGGRKRDVNIEWTDTSYTLHVTGPKATLEWAASGIPHRRACQQLLDETKAVVAAAQKAEGDARLTTTEASKLPRFGVCQPGGLGSWALGLKAVSGRGGRRSAAFITWNWTWCA